MLRQGPSSRAGASWSMDSGSDDSHRWSDTLSIDEKEGFVFVNYSEGQTKGPHPQPAHPGQGPLPQPIHPSAAEARTYNQLKAGGCPFPDVSSLFQNLGDLICVGFLFVCSQDTDGSASWSSGASSPCTQRSIARIMLTRLRLPPSPSPSNLFL